MELRPWQKRPKLRCLKNLDVQLGGFDVTRDAWTSG